jgi:hypothetical protein
MTEQSDEAREARPDFRPSAQDYAFTVVKAAVSAVPVIGGPVAELLNLLTPAVQKRRDAFLMEVAQDVDEMKMSGVNVEQLFENDEFLSSLLQAVQITLRTHQREKLDALRNAVKNSAHPSAPSADVRLMFLGFVDTFTVWHLKTLEYYRVERKHNFGLGEFLANTGQAPNPSLVEPFPDLREQKAFADQVVRDLLNHGLLSTKSGLTITTPFGQQFLAFISDRTP